MSETTVKTGISGNKRQTQFNDEKIVGLGEVKVITINPTEEEFKELLNIELKEDSKATEYLGESRDGNRTLRIDIWVENVALKKRDKITYFLEDKVRTNKDETKQQYINSIGVCSWASDPNDLPEWFVARDYREAKNGEEDFYNFLRSWLAFDYSKNSDTVLSLDWNKLMKDNLKDVKDLIGSEVDSTFVGLYTVRTVSKEGEDDKEYQGIYNKAFLPVYSLKYFSLVDYNKDEEVDKLKKKDPKKLKPHERFVLQVKSEHGCKDSFVLKKAIPYNPEDFLVASNEPIQEDDPSY